MISEFAAETAIKINNMAQEKEDKIAAGYSKNLFSIE